MISEKELERRMTLCRERAARLWCDDRTSHLVMMPELAEVIAEQLYHESYKPNLGLATTGEMLDEIKARVDLNYKTLSDSGD